MDAFYAVDSNPLLSSANVSVADGIVATFDHVAGTGIIGKRGAGRLRITGDSSPAGASISVLEGSLQIDGTYQNVPLSIPGGGSFFTVFSVSGFGANTLLGTGTILGSVRISIAPGVDAPGRLTIGTISTSSDPSSINIELAGTTPIVDYDQLLVLNATRLDGRSLDVTLLNNFTPTLGTQFTIIDDRFTGPITGAFNNLPQNTVFYADGRAFQIDYLGGDGNDVVLTAVVPEPSACGVFASLFIVLAGKRARHHQVIFFWSM